MKRIATTLAALAVAFFGAGLLTMATSLPANAYPDAAITVQISDTTVFSGETFTVDASANTDCDWSATFAGTTHNGAGESFTTSFTAPKVHQKKVYPLTVRCTYASSADGTTVTAAGGQGAGGTSTASRSFDITVLPRNAQGGPHATSNGSTPAGVGGFLPNTGGPAFWVLVAAVLLLLGGSALVWQRRRVHGH